MVRITRITAGFTLLAAGSAMLFLPGPGIVTIVAGLALLSKDIEWAGNLSERMRSRLGQRSTRDGNQAGG